jgi:hypothetical protein
MKYLAISLCLSFVLPAFAESRNALGLEGIQSMLDPINHVPEGSTRNTVREIYDLYNKARKATPDQYDPSYRAYLLEREQQAERDDIVCVECPRLSKLASEVNSVLAEMARDPKMSEQADLLEQIGVLEAMSQITMKHQENGTTGECSSVRLSRWLDDEFHKFDSEQATLVFTRNIPLEKVSGVQYRVPGRSRIYFFRGQAPHAEKVVRVVVPENGEASVDYFVLRDLNNLPDFRPRALLSSDTEVKKEEATAAKPSGPKVYGAWVKDSEGAKGEENNTEVNYGLGLEMDGIKPKRLVVFEGQTKQQLAQDLNLRASAEVSSNKRELQASLTDDKGSASVSIRMRDDRSGDVTVPYTIGVFDTGLKVNGDIAVGFDGQTRTNFVLKDGNAALVSGNYSYDARADKAKVEFSHSRKIAGGDLSLGASSENNYRNRETTQSVWMRYQMRF